MYKAWRRKGSRIQTFRSLQPHGMIVLANHSKYFSTVHQSLCDGVNKDALCDSFVFLGGKLVKDE